MGDDAKRREGPPARSPGGDYASAHLITLVSREGAPFGQVAEKHMVLNEAGRVVAEEWQRLAAQVPGVRAGELVVMPNHMHGIIYLAAGGGKRGRRRLRRCRLSDAALLGTAVARLKAAVTRRVSMLGGPGSGPLWQVGYRDVAIESAPELAAVRRLIRENPARWAEDVDNPARRAAMQAQTDR